MHESDYQSNVVDRHEEMLDGKRLGFFIGDGMLDLLRRYDCQIEPEEWLWRGTECCVQSDMGVLRASNQKSVSCF